VDIRIWNVTETWEKLIQNRTSNYLMTREISFNRAVKNQHLSMLSTVPLMSNSKQGQIISQIHTQRSIQFQRDQFKCCLLKKAHLNLYTIRPCTIGLTYQPSSLTLLIRGSEEIRIIIYIQWSPSNKKSET